jgi:hypothetical protein
VSYFVEHIADERGSGDGEVEKDRVATFSMVSGLEEVATTTDSIFKGKPF